jgi:hypothetical protein
LSVCSAKQKGYKRCANHAIKERQTMNEEKEPSNVVMLRPSTLQKACEEASATKPLTWVLVVLTPDEKVKVWGPEGFNLIEMLGMIEYSKSQMEQNI